MTLVLALALFVQEDLSAKARDMETAVNAVDALYREILSLQGDYEAAQQQRDMAALRAIYARYQKIAGEFQTKLAATTASLDAAVEQTPDDRDLLYPRARLHVMAGAEDKAVADLDRFLEKRPDHRDARMLRAQIDHALQRYDSARTHLETLLKKHPTHLPALIFRGQVDQETNRFAEARAWFAKAIAIEPTHWEANYLDALCAFNAHDFKACRERLDAFAQSKPQLAPPAQAELERVANDARQYAGFWESEQKLRAAEEKADDLPRVRIVTTAGEIELELFENEAPITVANFIALAESKFFDGTKFHRVIPAFMIQGGDPLSKNEDPSDDGSGDPGYTFDDELPEGRYRRHFRGSLSMANSGPDTNGSQFFITHVPTSWLNGKHTVFGRVLRGMDVVDRTKKDDAIKSVLVLRKRAHEYKKPR